MEIGAGKARRAVRGQECVALRQDMRESQSVGEVSYSQRNNNVGAPTSMAALLFFVAPVSCWLEAGATKNCLWMSSGKAGDARWAASSVGARTWGAAVLRPTQSNVGAWAFAAAFEPFNGDGLLRPSVAL